MVKDVTYILESLENKKYTLCIYTGVDRRES